uniref:Uncharacterized protein n=1 Tax=Arundo donax TaxID=35708 RepID=A0A0A9DXQ8_ARUDO
MLASGLISSAASHDREVTMSSQLSLPSPLEEEIPAEARNRLTSIFSCPFIASSIAFSRSTLALLVLASCSSPGDGKLDWPHFIPSL